MFKRKNLRIGRSGVMSNKIAELTKSRFFPFALILYLSYIILLLILAIPYIPEMFNGNAYTGGVYINPIVIFGSAAVTPVILIFVIVEFKQLTAPFRALNRRILAYTTLFLLLQFGLNILLAVCLILVNPDLLILATHTSDEFILVWAASFSFCVFAVVLNIFIGWKWVKVDLETPSGLHWFVGYFLYLLTVSLAVISILILNPTVNNIILWPLAGVAILGALNFFLVSWGFFIAGLETLSGESHAFVDFVFMTGTLFMLFALFLPVFYVIAYFFGVKLANRRALNRTNRYLR